MGTPAIQNKRDERRDAIIDVARACFLADGYAATSMSTIAARVGGSKGTLYNYFRSKEELFAAVMDRQCVVLGETLFDAAGDGDELQDRLGQFVRGFLETLLSADSLALYRVVVGEAERFPELGRTFYESGPRILLARIAAYLGEQMAQGRLRRADPQTAAEQLKDLALSGLHQKRLWNVIAAPSPQAVDAQVATAVDTFLRAYRPD